MELAYERGLLSGTELGEVQEKLLILYLSKKRREEVELEEMRFENNFMVSQPELYQDWKKRQEETQENEGVLWGAPESIEEARELEKLFARMDSEVERINRREETTETSIQNYIGQVETTQLLPDLDLEKFGEDLDG